ncbi:60 kDa inner membrane protein [Toxoplasma gondii VAND]|uniref:60 kDa inner membrane protein n=1 Tax=Toxoplasma gondii VAND TaxID=933077 RepID=A0A086QAK9_TOXGO|nr:60 kDa inner membrane protein [Toxoplasma gondii VAND]
MLRLRPVLRLPRAPRLSGIKSISREGSSRSQFLSVSATGDCARPLNFPASQATSLTPASSFFCFSCPSPPRSLSARTSVSSSSSAPSTGDPSSSFPLLSRLPTVSPSSALRTPPLNRRRPPAIRSQARTPLPSCRGSSPLASCSPSDVSAPRLFSSSSLASPSFSPLSLPSRCFFSLRSVFGEQAAPQPRQQGETVSHVQSGLDSKVDKATPQTLSGATSSGPEAEDGASSEASSSSGGGNASSTSSDTLSGGSRSSSISGTAVPVDAANVEKGADGGEQVDPGSLFVEPPEFTGPSDGSYAAVLYERIKDHTDSWLSNGSAVNCASDWLLLAKDSLGLPWAMALPIIGCSLRLLTLPFAIAAERDIRLRGLHGAEFMELNKMLKEKQKVGLGSPEFLKEREKVKKFIDAHNLSVFPMSSVQMLFIGLTISLFSYALRNMAVRVDEFPAFIAEHPGWFETLALPDPTLATTFLTIFGGLSILIAGWMVSDKLKKFSPIKTTGPLSPATARILPSVFIVAYATFMGTAFPGGLVLLLLPAAFLQIILARVFRLRSVTRALNFVPDSAKPLHAVHADILRQRVPELVKEWEKLAAAKNISPRKMGKGIVALWKEKCMDPKFQSLLKNSKQQRDFRGREGGAARPSTMLRPNAGFQRDYF